MNKIYIDFTCLTSLFIPFLLASFGTSLFAQDSQEYPNTPSLRRIDADKVNRTELPTDQLHIGFLYTRFDIRRTKKDEWWLKDEVTILRTMFPEAHFYTEPDADEALEMDQVLHALDKFADTEKKPNTEPLDLLHLGISTEVADQRTLLQEALQTLRKQGAKIVAPAGNEGEPVNGGFLARDTIPAVFDEVITVSALQEKLPDDQTGLDPRNFWDHNTSRERFAPWSNYGPSVDVIAPGSPIQNELVHEDDDALSYDHRKGNTEDAAQHVSGTIGLMLAAAKKTGRSLSQQQVRALLERTGEYPNSGHWTGDYDEHTEPMVDADDAVNAVGNQSELPKSGYDIEGRYRVRTLFGEEKIILRLRLDRVNQSQIPEEALLNRTVNAAYSVKIVENNSGEPQKRLPEYIGLAEDPEGHQWFVLWDQDTQDAEYAIVADLKDEDGNILLGDDIPDDPNNPKVYLKFLPIE